MKGWDGLWLTTCVLVLLCIVFLMAWAAGKVFG